MEIKGIRHDCKAKETLKKGQETLINKRLYVIGSYCIVGTEKEQQKQMFSYIRSFPPKANITHFNTILKNYKGGKK